MGIDRNNAVLNMMYRGTTTIEDFNWDAMTTVPILYLMTPQDIDYIKNLILSPRYSGNNKYKMEKIDEVMHYRGFSRFAGGTNRLVYVHPLAPNAVFKVAIDSVGINDNPAEFRNQKFLKPYCCKVFECTPCGTIASFEKVDRITTFEEFYTIADDYYYIIVNVILGKYVMDDIGIDYFMNVGIRVGCYPVLLDFPYLFELDGRKLECCNVLDDGRVCGGEIDYDGGFNKLVCKKCGRVYRARDLAKPPKEGGVLLRQKGGRRMKLEITRGGKVIKTYDTTIERDYLSRNDRDVTNNRAAEVVLKHVEVKTKKVEAPIHHEEKVAHRVAQASTPVITKRVVKEIDVSSKKTDTPEATAPKTSIELNITKKTKIVPKPAPKKEQATDTRKVVTGPKTEVTQLEKPIVGRVIDVSIDKPKASTDVVKAEVGSTPSVEVCITRSKEIVRTEHKKEEHIDRIDGTPIVKAEDNTPKKVRTVEINVQKVNELDKNDRVFTEEAVNGAIEETKKLDNEVVAEAYREMIQPTVVEDIDKTSLHQSNMIQVELTPSPKAMQQAIFFGDEPGGYDPNAEQKEEPAPSEEEDVTFQEQEHKIAIGQELKFIGCAEVIDGDPEYDTNVIMDYCNTHNITPKSGSIVMIYHKGKVNEETASEEPCIKFYACIDPEKNIWDSVEFNVDNANIELPKADACYDNSGEEPEESEVAGEDEQYPDVSPDDVDEDPEPATEGKTDDSDSAEEEEDEYEYQITLVEEVPSDDEAEDDVFYCLPRHNRVDTSKLAEIKDPIDIDTNEYRIYFKTDGSVEQIMFDYDNDEWIVMSEEAYMKLSNMSQDKIIYVDELPELEDAIPDHYYLLKISHHAYDAFMRDDGAAWYRFCFVIIDDDPSVEVVDDLPSFEEAKENTLYALRFLPDGAKKGLYLKNVKAGRFDFIVDSDAYDKAVGTNEESEPEVETPKTDEEDVDELIEHLKASSKKKSLDEFMTE